MITRSQRVLGQQRLEATDVVEVGMGEPDPTEVGGIDDRAQHGQELLALDHRAGVDENRFRSVHDVSVDGDEAEARDGEG